MNIENFYQEKIWLDDIEWLMLWLVKNKLKWNYENLELFIDEIKNAISLINNNIKKIIIFDYKHQDVLNNIPTYLEKIQKENVQEISNENLKDFRSQLSRMKGYRKKLTFLKHFLELDNRMSYTREDFIKKITNDFSQLKFEIWERNFIQKSNWENIIDLPISDLNLEWHWFQNWDLNLALDKIQVLIDKVIENQINSNYNSKTINLIFLWNVINRNLVLEQDFQESLVNYNLTFEFSIFLLKVISLLRNFFPNVNLIFSIDKSNYRPNENKEHFRNYNLNFDRIIPKLIWKKLDWIDWINVLEPNEYDYFNALKYVSGTATILYWDLKMLNQHSKIKFNNFEKSFLKEIWEKENIKRVTRFYIWWKELYIYNDFYRKIRQIPSFFDINNIEKDNGKLLYFVLNNKWEELETNWVDISKENPKVYLHSIDYKKDIQYYDFIQNTILTNKKDKQNIILAL